MSRRLLLSGLILSFSLLFLLLFFALVCWAFLQFASDLFHSFKDSIVFSPLLLELTRLPGHLLTAPPSLQHSADEFNYHSWLQLRGWLLLKSWTHNPRAGPVDSLCVEVKGGAQMFSCVWRGSCLPEGRVPGLDKGLHVCAVMRGPCVAQMCGPDGWTRWEKMSPLLWLLLIKGKYVSTPEEVDHRSVNQLDGTLVLGKLGKKKNWRSFWLDSILFIHLWSWRMWISFRLSELSK